MFRIASKRLQIARFPSKQKSAVLPGTLAVSANGVLNSSFDSTNYCAYDIIMCISQKEFNRQCSRFVSICRQLDGQWTLLEKTSNQVNEITAEAIGEAELDNMRLMLVRNELKTRQPGDQVWTYEYNVIYSDSYEVPVMYFSASRQDGSLVDLGDISSLFLTEKHYENLGQVVSQVEHPILFRPFHMIHPCRTKDFMELHSGTSASNYLISWLSTIGTVIDLKLDLSLARLFV